MVQLSKKLSFSTYSYSKALLTVPCSFRAHESLGLSLKLTLWTVKAFATVSCWLGGIELRTKLTRRTNGAIRVLC